MADLNRVFLMGSLTFDPELRRTPSGTAVSELRLVTSRSWMSKEGERREEKLFIDVTVWDRQAEICCERLRKGSGIHVEGSLRMDTWEDKSTGEKRSKIRVHADRVQFLDSRRGDSLGEAGMSSDDEAGNPGRDASPRRSSAPPARGPSSASAATRMASDGPGDPNGAAGRSPSGGAREDEAEDIPF
jgi:single-strand DNA-binding protein